MKKWLHLLLLGSTLLSAPAAYGSDWAGLIRLLSRLNDTTDLIKLDIDQLNALLSEASQWGTWRFTDSHSWGETAAQWQRVLDLAQRRGDGSPLGRTLQPLAKEFPIETQVYNQTNPSSLDQRYYALQAETALAARAASELSYNKIQEQINYAKQLKDQINTTTSLKQAVDLQSRLIIENHLIQLEMLRQLAVINQQQAIQSQATVNDMAQTAHFLLPKP